MPTEVEKRWGSFYADAGRGDRAFRHTAVVQACSRVEAALDKRGIRADSLEKRMIMVAVASNNLSLNAAIHIAVKLRNLLSHTQTPASVLECQRAVIALGEVYSKCERVSTGLPSINEFNELVDERMAEAEEALRVQAAVAAARLEETMRAHEAAAVTRSAKLERTLLWASAGVGGTIVLAIIALLTREQAGTHKPVEPLEPTVARQVAQVDLDAGSAAPPERDVIEAKRTGAHVPKHDGKSHQPVENHDPPKMPKPEPDSSPQVASDQGTPVASSTTTATLVSAQPEQLTGLSATSPLSQQCKQCGSLRWRCYPRGSTIYVTNSGTLCQSDGVNFFISGRTKAGGLTPAGWFAQFSIEVAPGIEYGMTQDSRLFVPTRATSGQPSGYCEPYTCQPETGSDGDKTGTRFL